MIDLTTFRKMIACLPFADADAGTVETMLAMGDAADEIERLRWACGLALPLLQETRRLIVNSETIDGDESTMDDEVKTEVADYDAAIEAVRMGVVS